MARSRTNIEIDDGHVQAVMDRYGVHTKTEAVDLALRHPGPGIMSSGYSKYVRIARGNAADGSCALPQADHRR